MVCLPLKPIVSERFLRFTFVNARPVWFPSLPSLQKIASSVWLYGFDLFGAFTFSLVVKLLRFCFECFLGLYELTTNYDAHWIVLVLKIVIFGCLHYSQ